MAPKFIMKLWSILEDAENEKYICWDMRGEVVCILHAEKFMKEVVPKYYKHRQFSSFVRQLNCYGFTKIRRTRISSLLSSMNRSAYQRQNDSMRMEFRNPYFKRGRSDLLSLISRGISPYCNLVSNNNNNPINNSTPPPDAPTDDPQLLQQQKLLLQQFQQQQQQQHQPTIPSYQLQYNYANFHNFCDDITPGIDNNAGYDDQMIRTYSVDQPSSIMISPPTLYYQINNHPPHPQHYEPPIYNQPIYNNNNHLQHTTSMMSNYPQLPSSDEDDSDDFQAIQSEKERAHLMNVTNHHQYKGAIKIEPPHYTYQNLQYHSSMVLDNNPSPGTSSLSSSSTSSIPYCSSYAMHPPHFNQSTSPPPPPPVLNNNSYNYIKKTNDVICSPPSPPPCPNSMLFNPNEETRKSVLAGVSFSFEYRNLTEQPIPYNYETPCNNNNNGDESSYLNNPVYSSNSFPNTNGNSFLPHGGNKHY